MNPTPQRAEPLHMPAAEVEPLDLTSDQIAVQPSFDPHQWEESRAEAEGAGGRQVLGAGLIALAALWLAYTAWSAGRSLAAQPLSSPAIAEWIATAAGPLALLGLV